MAVGTVKRWKSDKIKEKKNITTDVTSKTR
jgi:hypothetical protein